MHEGKYNIIIHPSAGARSVTGKRYAPKSAARATGVLASSERAASERRRVVCVIAGLSCVYIGMGVLHRVGELSARLVGIIFPALERPPFYSLVRNRRCCAGRWPLLSCALAGACRPRRGSDWFCMDTHWQLSVIERFEQFFVTAR